MTLCRLYILFRYRTTSYCPVTCLNNAYVYSNDFRRYFSDSRGDAVYRGACVSFRGFRFAWRTNPAGVPISFAVQHPCERAPRCRPPNRLVNLVSSLLVQSSPLELIQTTAQASLPFDAGSLTECFLVQARDRPGSYNKYPAPHASQSFG
jgi:hypothetical protein